MLCGKYKYNNPLILCRYADLDAYNSHLATQIVTDMFTWINSANIYQRPALVYNVTYSAELDFIGPEVAMPAIPMLFSENWILVKENSINPWGSLKRW